MKKLINAVGQFFLECGLQMLQMRYEIAAKEGRTFPWLRFHIALRFGSGFQREQSIAMALLLASAATSRAQTLVCDGVLGNSGEKGQSLVRFAPKPASGLGVAADSFGSLWDRAGVGTLNRYAADGRLLAQYPIPKGTAGANGNDKIALVGDLIVLKLGNGLYSLPITAPAGTAATDLKIKATQMSFGASDGWLAASNGVELFRFKPATGEKQPVETLAAPPNSLEMGPDGAILTSTRGNVVKIGEMGDPKKISTGQLQWLDGAWWGHSYHGTIVRYDSDLELSPGVVLGGASGSFIGHLDENAELNNGRGLAKVRPDVYAVSGWEGVLHLLQWDREAQRMEIVRRIGSVPTCSGLGLDSAGRVWWSAGSWNWIDRPDAPLQNGVIADEVSQAVTLPGENIVMVGRRNGKSAIFQGPLTKELTTNFVTPDWDKTANYVGAATYLGAKNERFLLLVSEKGEARQLSLTNEGKMRRDDGAVLLQTATPIQKWTSLATKDDQTLLGAGDGSVIELAREGDGWKERARWNSWDDQKFGAQIWIAWDAGWLWVSDRDNNRVLCFDGATKKLLASFGGAAGDDLAHFDAPQILVARGARAVVFDSANQRLMKLRFEE